MSEFHFSPSDLHHHLLDNMEYPLFYKGGDVKLWQANWRNKLKKLLGDMPKEKCPLNIRSLWKLDHELGIIEKIVFTSEDFCNVPAYICLP